jgi:hypothetical protein
MLESATLIALGLACGVYISNRQVFSVQCSAGFDAPVALSTVPQNGRVSNVRIVSADASTATVEFTGDVVQPLRFTGLLKTIRHDVFSSAQYRIP